MHNEGNYKQGEKATFRIGKNKGNKTTDKELISKIYKKLMQPNTRKQTTQSKIGRTPKQTFLQRTRTDGEQAHE